MFHRDIAPGVHWYEDGYVNWYIVQEGSELTIVDAGLPSSWGSLQKALEQLGRSRADVKALVLTHAHFDHVGFAERIRREWNVPVYVHERDQPLTRHPLIYDHERAVTRYLWRPSCLKVVTAFTFMGMLWTPAIKDVRVYRSDDTLDVPGTPKVIPTPGHTYGHCSLLLSSRDTLLAGDALVQTDPYTLLPGPRMVARAATANTEQNRQSLIKLADFGAKTVLTGHGAPLSDLPAAAKIASQAPVA